MFGSKSASLFVFLSALLLNSPLQARETDPCDALNGQWQGGMIIKGGRGGTCAWSAEASIQRKDQFVLIALNLAPPVGPDICKAFDRDVVLTASCQNGQVEIVREKLQGSASVNRIELAGHNNVTRIWLDREHD